MEEPATPMPSYRQDTRRSFLSITLGTATAIFSASLLYPLIKFLWPPAATVGGEGSVGIPVEDLLVGQSRVVSLKGEPVLIIREENKVVALSAVCPHLGCVVRYKGGGSILCPCHEASFDLNGNVTGGPSPRPLTYYPVRIVGGRIVVES